MIPGTELDAYKLSFYFQMIELERAIRLGLEADLSKESYAATEFGFLEKVDKRANREEKLIRYRATAQSQINSSSFISSNTSFGEDFNGYNSCATTKKNVDELKSEQVYWIKD